MSQQTQLQGTQETTWRGADVVETTFTGALDPQVVQGALDDFLRLVGTAQAPAWLFVFNDVAIAQSIRQTAVGVLQRYREMGGTNVAAVIDALVLRMVAVAISKAAGTQVEFFATRDQALRELR